jgi:hypothetical protein
MPLRLHILHVVGHALSDREGNFMSLKGMSTQTDVKEKARGWRFHLRILACGGAPTITICNIFNQMSEKMQWFIDIQITCIRYSILLCKLQCHILAVRVVTYPKDHLLNSKKSLHCNP